MPKKGRQQCGRCKRTLALDKFAPSKRGKTGRWCRACFKEYQQLKRWLSKRQGSKGGGKGGRNSKARLWQVSLSSRSAERDLTVLVFSCKRCNQAVRPIFRKSYITRRGVVVALVCPRCDNGCLIDIDARQTAA